MRKELLNGITKQHQMDFRYHNIIWDIIMSIIYYSPTSIQILKWHIIGIVLLQNKNLVRQSKKYKKA